MFFMPFQVCSYQVCFYVLSGDKNDKIWRSPAYLFLALIGAGELLEPKLA